jgi:uncharacterized membrane protein YheB (UPF0754 family)
LNIILWLVPPLVGAVIGYITNAVAIKMLFRPLKEVRILNWRLPFTPGILPRQRHKLAISIGRMVERELLTPEIIRQRLERDDVHLSIKNSIARYTETFLSTPLGSIGGEVSDHISGADGKSVIGSILRSFFQSSAFESVFDSVIEIACEKLFSENDGTLLNKSIRGILGDGQIEALKRRLEQFVAEYIQNNSGHLAEQAAHIFDSAFPQIAALCIRFLDQPDVRSELESQGQIFLNGAIHKLSSFQRFFLSAGQYDKTLSEKMPEIIDDLIRQVGQLISDNSLKQKLLVLFTQSADKFLSSDEAGIRSQIIVSGFVVSCADKPLYDLFKDLNRNKVSASSNVKAFAQKLFELVKNGLSNGSTTGAMGDFFGKLIERHKDTPISDFFIITREQKNDLDDLITKGILSIANKQIEGALKSINVLELVSDRIDALDMIKVEGIILDIMASQLQWINVFGAILGAFIGIFQSLFSWLIR